MVLFVADLAFFVIAIMWMVVSSLMEEAAEPARGWLRRRKAHLNSHSPAWVLRLAERLNSVNRNERIAAATLLGEVHDCRAVPVLVRAMERHPGDPLFLQAAVEALERLGDPRALPALYPLTAGRNYSLMQAAREAVAALEPKAVLLRAGVAPLAETRSLLHPVSTSQADLPAGLLRAWEEPRP